MLTGLCDLRTAHTCVGEQTIPVYDQQLDFSKSFKKNYILLYYLLQRDCCATCYNLSPTTTSSATICPNVWNDATCESLLQSLGNCSNIQEQCCKTCYEEPVTTPMLTTMDSCQDLWQSSVCQLVIDNEGEGRYYD